MSSDASKASSQAGERAVASQGTAGLSARDVVMLELLKARMSEVTSWVGHILQASAIFAILSVGLYKFALDANSTPSLRLALSVIGILVSFAGFLGCILMERLRRRNSTDQHALLDALSKSPFPIHPNGADVIKYSNLSAAIAVTINLGAWIYILLTTG